jgi:tetratricopeptide (TPR) repeat protein
MRDENPINERSPANDDRPPWSPTGIALITILAPIAGGILHALNERRLGRVEQWRASLYENLTASLVVFVLNWARATPMWVASLLTLMLATWFYKSQASAFETRLEAGGQKASFALPLTIVLGCLVLLTLGALAFFLVEDQWATKRFERGIALMDAGRDAEAAQAFERYQELVPYDPEGYWSLAAIHIRNQRYAEAKAELEELLAIEPGDEYAKEVLGRVEGFLATSEEGSGKSRPSP